MGLTEVNGCTHWAPAVLVADALESMPVRELAPVRAAAPVEYARRADERGADHEDDGACVPAPASVCCEIRERGGYRHAGWCHPLLWWVEDVLDLYSNDASDGRGLGVCNSCMNL